MKKQIDPWTKRFIIKTIIYVVINAVCIVFIRTNASVKDFVAKSFLIIGLLFVISFVVALVLSSVKPEKYEALGEYAFSSRFYILLLIPIFLAAWLD